MYKKKDQREKKKETLWLCCVLSAEPTMMSPSATVALVTSPLSPANQRPAAGRHLTVDGPVLDGRRAAA